MISSFNSTKFLTIKQLSLLNTEIIALQELNCDLKVLKRSATYSLPSKKVLFSCSQVNKYESMALYYDQSFNLISFHEIVKGRLLKVTLEKSGQIFHVYNVYNYTSSHLASSFELLQLLSNDILRNDTSVPTLVLGDFNVNISKETRSSIYLQNLISDLDLIDTAAWFSSPLPTWKGDGNRISSESRLDLILTKNFDLSNLRFNLIPAPTSDHVIIQLENNAYKPPPLLTCTIISTKHFLTIPIFENLFSPILSLF